MLALFEAYRAADAAAHAPEVKDEDTFNALVEVMSLAADRLLAYRPKNMAEVRAKADFIYSNRFIQECLLGGDMSAALFLQSLITPTETVGTQP